MSVAWEILLLVLFAGGGTKGGLLPVPVVEAATPLCDVVIVGEDGLGVTLFALVVLDKVGCSTVVAVDFGSFLLVAEVDSVFAFIGCGCGGGGGLFVVFVVVVPGIVFGRRLFGWFDLDDAMAGMADLLRLTTRLRTMRFFPSAVRVTVSEMIFPSAGFFVVVIVVVASLALVFLDNETLPVACVVLVVVDCCLSVPILFLVIIDVLLLDETDASVDGVRLTTRFLLFKPIEESL